MDKIKNVVDLFNIIKNDYHLANELSDCYKEDFIEMIKNGSQVELLYAYEVCHVFNLTKKDCDKFVY